MNSRCHIREAEIADLEQLKHLYRQMHPDDPSANDQREVTVLTEIVDSPNLHIFLLCEDSQIRATTYLNIIPNLTRGASPYAVVENVVTERHVQRQGYGRRLMRHTLDFAWQRGCYKVMLLTGSKRDSVHSFYCACGFNGDSKHGFIARPN